MSRRSTSQSSSGKFFLPLNTINEAPPSTHAATTNLAKSASTSSAAQTPVSPTSFPLAQSTSLSSIGTAFGKLVKPPQTQTAPARTPSMTSRDQFLSGSSESFPSQQQLPSPRIPLGKQISTPALSGFGTGKMQPEEVLVRLLAQIEKPTADAVNSSDVFNLLFEMLLDVSLTGKKGANELDVFAVFFGMFSVCHEVAKYGLIQKFNDLVTTHTRLKEYCVGHDHMRRLLELTLTEESGPVLGQLILLVQTLGLFTFGVTDLKSMFRMLQSTKGVRPRNWSLLLHFIQKMSIRNISTTSSELESFFDFNGTDGTGIGLPAANITWPTTTPGYSFLTWLRVESFDDPNSIPNFRPHIFYLMTSEETGQAVSLFFQSRHLHLSVQLTRSKREVVKFNRVFEEKRAYCIALSHVHRLFKSEVTLFVDGQFEESLQLVYPKFDYPLAEGLLGSGRDPGLQRLQPFFGQMSTTFFFNEPMTLVQVKQLFTQGPRVSIVEANRILRTTPQDAGAGQHGTTRLLTLGFGGGQKAEPEDVNKVVMGYTPPAVSNRSCIEIGSRLESRKARLLGETSVWKRQNLPSTLYSVGGMKVLLPLFLQLADKEHPKNLSDTSVHTVDPFRLMLSLLQILLQDPNHQEDMLVNNAFFVIGLILQNIAPSFWTLETMMSLDQLCTSIAANEQLYRQFILSIYLNFRIWIYTDPSVQLELIRIILSHMKKKPEVFRTELFSVQTILDVIHTFYWTVPDEYSLGRTTQETDFVRERPPPAELLNIRASLMNIIFYLAGDNPTFAETKALVLFAVESSDNALVESALKYLLKLLCNAVRKWRNDTTQKRLFSSNRPVMDMKNICSHLLGLGDILPFVSLLSRPNIKIRILALKIIGALLEPLQKLKGPEGVDYLFPTVKQKLGCFALTELTYNTLKEVLLGRVSPQLVSSDPMDNVEPAFQSPSSRQAATEPASDDFIHPKMISVIFELLWPASSKTDVIRTALKDFILLIDLSHQNRRDFIAHPLWPMWLLELLSAQTASTPGAPQRFSSPLVNNELPAADDIKSLIINLFSRLLQGCLHDLYGWKQFVSLRAYLSQYSNRNNLDTLRLLTTFNRSVLHYISANNYKLLDMLRTDPILCENVLKWVSTVEMSLFSPLHAAQPRGRQSAIEWSPSNDDLFLIGVYRSTLDNAWADFDFAQEVIHFLDALIPSLPASSPRSSGSKSPLYRFYFRLLIYSIKEAKILKDKTKGTSNNNSISTLQSIFHNNIEEITSNRFHHAFSKFINKKKNAFEDQKNRLQVSLQMNAERLRCRIGELWKSRSNSYGSNSQHLEHRTVYLLSFIQSLITTHCKEESPRECSAREPLLNAFSEILLMARDNTDWGAEFQGIPTEAMVQFFLAHLSEPDHKFALSSLFEESVDAVMQEEALFQDSITAYLEAECGNVYETSGRVAAHENNDSLKFEQRSLFFMADKLAVEANRKRTAFLDQEHKQQTLVKQWRRLARKALYHSRGPWTIPSEADESQLKWKLDLKETLHRMRRKLKRNYNFRDHAGCASEQQPETLQLQSSADSDGAIESAKKTLESSKGSISKAPEGMEERSLTGSSDSISPSSEHHPTERTDATPNWDADKRQILFRVKAELIQPMLITIGEIEITSTHFYFLAQRSTKDIRNRAAENAKAEEDSLPKKNRRWNLKSFRSVFRRRFLLQPSAFEIFAVNGRNYFFNITSSIEDCERLLKKIVQLSPKIDVHFGNPVTRLKVMKVTERWQRRQLSNFEYLMALNSIAGRTYNDLTQYPIFPWIIADYTSSHLDLRNPAVYRDLSKPIGALSPKRLELILDRFEAFEDPLIPKFHYGSHYSNIGIALYFLIRLEPFTTYNLDLQEGHFDHADRLFTSIPEAWNNCMVNPADVKELIPEFFYLPEFLTNSNGFYFGKDQNNSPVGDVQLPPWASSPEEFIRINRAALESEYVSEHLHEWIDLIFGFKQRGKAAEEAHNLFFHLTYEGVVNLESISDPVTRQAIECQIINFGQTPPQLFNRPHVKRMSLDECFPLRRQISALPQKAITYSMQSKAPVIYIGRASNTNNSTAFIVVHRDGVFTECSLTKSPDPSKNLPFTFHVPSLPNNKSPKETVELSLTDESSLLSAYFTNTVDGKTIICGGHWDDSFKFISMANGAVKAKVNKHKDKVAAVALGEDGMTLVTGSYDTTVIVWDVEQIISACERNHIPKPLGILCGHDDHVTCVAINVDLDVVVSGSLDNTCIIHSLSTGVYIRSINCGGPVRLVEISPVDGDIYVLHDSPPTQLFSASTVSLDDSGDAGSRVLTRYTINGQKLKSVETPQQLSGIALSKDGRFVVTSGDQLCIAIRNANLELVHVYYCKCQINCLTFSPEGDLLFAGLANGKVDVYPWDDSRWR